MGTGGKQYAPNWPQVRKLGRNRPRQGKTAGLTTYVLFWAGNRPLGAHTTSRREEGKREGGGQNWSSWWQAAKAAALIRRLVAPLLKYTSSSPFHCRSSTPATRYRQPPALHLSSCFKSPSPSTSTYAPASFCDIHTCPFASGLSAPIRPCLLSCFGSHESLSCLPLFIFVCSTFARGCMGSWVHVLCSQYCVLLLHFNVGLSRTHVWSRLMPDCAWIIIFFDDYIAQSIKID